MKDDFTKFHSATIGIGTSKRESLEGRHGNSPGPGQYSIAQKAFGVARFAMGIKLKDANKMATPGPNNYNPSMK